MHIVAFALLILVVLIIIFKESFVQGFDMMISEARNPIYAKYFGRVKDPMGNDYFDNKLRKYVMQQVYVPNR